MSGAGGYTNGPSAGRRIVQLGERLPYKQEVTGSSPVPPTILDPIAAKAVCCLRSAGVAQEVEHRTENPSVGSSTLPPGTIISRRSSIGRAAES